MADALIMKCRNRTEVCHAVRMQIVETHMDFRSKSSPDELLVLVAGMEVLPNVS